MDANGTAIVFCLSPTGLSVARSLASHGVKVYGVDALWYEFGHFSRLICRDRRISRLAPGKELLDGLIALGKDLKSKPVIFNAGDEYIDFVAQNREVLKDYYTLTDSMRPEVNSVILNKRRFYEECLRLGVDLPTTAYPVDEATAQEAASRIRYPAIVKPSHGHRWRKLLRGRKLIEVASSDELMHWYRTFRDWGADVVFQECIVGPERNIAVAGMYTDSAGVCRSMFTAVKCRQYPPMYGSGSYMEAKWLPEIARLSQDLIERLGYHGVCGTEFKYDERDRKWKLIEVNVRPTLWFALTRGAGVDVVWDAYCDLRGTPNPIHVNQQNDHIRWQLFVRDLVSSIHFYRRGQLSAREFLRTTIDPRNKEPAVFSWTDWGVNLSYVLNTGMQIWRNFFARR